MFILSNIAGKPQKKLTPNKDRSLNILLKYGFIGVVADAAWAAQEKHRGRYTRGHHHGIVARTARHPSRGKASRFNGFREQRGQLLVHGHCRLIELLFRFEP